MKRTKKAYPSRASLPCYHCNMNTARPEDEGLCQGCRTGEPNRGHGGKSQARPKLSIHDRWGGLTGGHQILPLPMAE